MAEPDPAVLEAVAQLARYLPHVDADTAWARLAHLTPAQRAEVERVCSALPHPQSEIASNECSSMG